MNERVNPFASLADPPVFTTKPRKEKPVEEETIARIAEQHNFPSRQAPKTPKVTRHKARTHRTGRNTQFNAKATSETVQRFYKMADDRHVVLGELLKKGLDALEALEHFERLAQRRGSSLQEIVEEALSMLDGAGGSR